MMSDIKQVGVGEFGPIYEGIKGRKAVDFLILQRGGEIRNAFWHLEIGHIDLVWDSGEGKGLSSIIRDHPDAIVFLDKMIENGEVYQKTSNRVRLIARLGDKHGITIVRLDFDGKEKNWVLTGFLLEENI